jgi:hypothetical protein
LTNWIDPNNLDEQLIGVIHDLEETMKFSKCILPLSVFLLYGSPVFAQPAATTARPPVTAPPKTTTAPPRVQVDCPVASVSVGVKSPNPLPQPWWDTPFAMNLDSASLSTVGGAPALRCLYKGSGREWDIARPLAPDYQSCTLAGKSFMCIPGK